MNRGDKPEVCIYHGPTCFDGFAAAWAIWQQWPDVEFIPSQYGDEVPLDRIAGKSVLIVDFSYAYEDMMAIAHAARWAVVLDHHESAKDHLTPILKEGFMKGEFDMKRSGARMAWDYAWGNGRPPLLIAHVEDRDLWKFEIDGTKAVTAVLASIPLEFGAWTDFARRLEDPAGRVATIAEGAAILRTRDREIRQILDSSARPMAIAGADVFVANVPYHLASEAGHLLCRGRPFSATYFDRADGQRQWSLRSDPEGVEVHKIAEMFGGGGHKHAAGFTLPAEDWPTEDVALSLASAAADVDEIALSSGAGRVEIVSSEPAP